MKTNAGLTICLFASTRYWEDAEELKRVAEKMKADLPVEHGELKLILSQEDVENTEGGDIMVAVPMSGAVQALVIQAAEKFGAVCVYPGYIKGNVNDEATAKMLLLNAAPAVMDTYSVLKRTHPHVFMCLNQEALLKTLKIIRAYFSLRGGKLLLIGDIEPWVISVSRDLAVYESSLGIRFEKVSLEDMVARFNAVTDEEAKPLYDLWRNAAQKIEEPTDSDMMKAARFCVALKKMIEAHEAMGAAIACFNLLRQIDTTACLAVSYINSETDYVAACEGDVDSAVTMLMLKKLTNKGVWMANPNIQPNRTVNFVHCTAPVRICGANCPYSLRNHHESGLGVSPQIDFPNNLTLTACRLSDNAKKITIQRGTGRRDVYETSCRTQYTVAFDDFDKYIDTALGCHQVFAFEDITAELEELAKMLRLEVL